MITISLKHVRTMPQELQPGILYVSKEFETAAHLCPCGCKNKIVTPLGPTEWSFKEEKGLPTLYPSIGNWQLPCQSHYWVTKGKIKWSYKWSKEQIELGREMEMERRQKYFNSLDRKWKRRWMTNLIKWLRR